MTADMSEFEAGIGSEWTELGVSEWGTSVFFAPPGTDTPPPESRLYVPPAWSEDAS